MLPVILALLCAPQPCLSSHSLLPCRLHKRPPPHVSSFVIPPRPSIHTSVDLLAAIIHQQNVIALQGLELQCARVHAELAVQAKLEARTCEQLWHAGLEVEFSGWEVSTMVAEKEDFLSPSLLVSYGSSVRESDEDSESVSNSGESSEDSETSKGAGLASKIAALHSEVERELNAVAKERRFD